MGGVHKDLNKLAVIVLLRKPCFRLCICMSTNAYIIQLFTCTYSLIYSHAKFKGTNMNICIKHLQSKTCIHPSAMHVILYVYIYILHDLFYTICYGPL